jgi:DNA invertase Pin-like site-specific DNA recombinase
LLEIAAMERQTIRERMQSGQQQYIAKCRKEGIKMGRVEGYRKSDDNYKEQYSKEISLLRKRISLRNIQSITGTSVNTLRKIKSKFL